VQADVVMNEEEDDDDLDYGDDEGLDEDIDQLTNP
jgi:hypothetical protein